MKTMDLEKTKEILKYLKVLDKQYEESLEYSDAKFGKAIRETLNDLIINKGDINFSDCLTCIDMLLGCESDYSRLNLVRYIFADINKLIISSKQKQ